MRANYATLGDWRDHPKIQPIPESGCWVWTGATVSKGYGFARWNREFVLVHRKTWTLTNGQIPDGMFLDHKCRVPACCNPDHLRIVTPRVNTLENSNSPTAINAAKATCPKCDGEYRAMGGGKRRCIPCGLEFTRQWRKRQTPIGNKT